MNMGPSNTYKSTTTLNDSLHEYEVYGLLIASGTFVAMGSAVAQWQSVGFQRQRSWVRSSPAALCCVLEQGTFTSHSTG